MFVDIPDANRAIRATACEMQIVRTPGHIGDRASMTSTSLEDGPVFKLLVLPLLAVCLFVFFKGGFGLFDT